MVMAQTPFYRSNSKTTFTFHLATNKSFRSIDMSDFIRYSGTATHIRIDPGVTSIPDSAFEDRGVLSRLFFSGWPANDQRLYI